MKTAVYPGSFDPITCGHLDILKRGNEMFDRIKVVLFMNTSKKPLFTIEERMDMIRQSVTDLDNIEVDCYEGLVVDYMKMHDHRFLLRGLRSISDFESEFQMASMNKKMYPEVESIFLMTGHEHAYVSSSLIREIIRFDGNVQGMVPEYVHQKLVEKIKGMNR
ncbi:MAG TPA: pantetheine-phosphate adenylyltransferase [Eubacteriaceae bacterium]|nr:pantetheine-phosphate adenylyltransferase [Eubacteriaceae bacterium]